MSAIFVNQGIEPSKRPQLEVGIRSRENYLDKMVKLAAKELNFKKEQIKEMFFANVMTQNIDEQFIPPLFSDSGNKKRYTYGYIKGIHNVKMECLDKNRRTAERGTLTRLKKKIKDVYNCIILDDYSFSFKNNEQMAALKAGQIHLDKQKATIVN